MQCPDSVFRPVGRLVLKGKTEAIQVFRAVADERGIVRQAA